LKSRGASGHNSKAVHRAYTKRALMKIPLREDYEQKATLSCSRSIGETCCAAYPAISASPTSQCRSFSTHFENKLVVIQMNHSASHDSTNE
jgi:hypothetical protein